MTVAGINFSEVGILNRLTGAGKPCCNGISVPVEFAQDRISPDFSTGDHAVDALDVVDLRREAFRDDNVE